LEGNFAEFKKNLMRKPDANNHVNSKSKRKAKAKAKADTSTRNPQMKK
jgi:hypothetical protein